MTYFCHPTAVIDHGADIGNDCRIWHFVHVCSRAKIGSSVSLGQNVFIGNNVVVGDNCKIQNNVSVYDNVTIEADVFCGPSVVFTNVYNPRAFIERKSEYRDTLVCQGATLGANCTVVCGLKIGSYSFVGAGSVVTRNIKDFALVVGNPGRQIGWMSAFGERLELPMSGSAKTVCKQTGETYDLSRGIVTRRKEVT